MKRKPNNYFVYSTNPEKTKRIGEDETGNNIIELPLEKTIVRVALDSKHRNGKMVTLLPVFRCPNQIAKSWERN